MKAVVIREYGGPEVLSIEEIPEPLINRSDLLIQVNAFSINPFDCKIRSGQHPVCEMLDLPLVPGWDLAGTVISCGADASKFKPGDRLWPEQIHSGRGHMLNTLL